MLARIVVQKKEKKPNQFHLLVSKGLKKFILANHFEGGFFNQNRYYFVQDFIIPSKWGFFLKQPMTTGDNNQKEVVLYWTIIQTNCNDSISTT
jgi:hypothetical protein